MTRRAPSASRRIRERGILLAPLIRAVCVGVTLTGASACGPVRCTATDHALTAAEIGTQTCEIVDGDVDLRAQRSNSIDARALREVSGSVALPAQMPARGALQLQHVGHLSLVGADWTDLEPLASLQRIDRGFDLSFDWALEDLVGFENVASFGVDSDGVAGNVSCLARVSQAEADAFELAHRVDITFWLYPAPECSVD